MSKFVKTIWFVIILSIAAFVAMYFSLKNIINGQESVYISASVSLLIFLLTNKFNLEREMERVRKDETDRIYKKLEEKPDYKYVDEQDNAIMQTLKQHVTDSREVNETQMKFLKSIDDKVGILIGKI